MNEKMVMPVGQHEIDRANSDRYIILGKEYRIDDYDIRFVYTEDNVESTHFILEKRKRSDTM